MFMARQAIRRCYRVYNSLGEESLCVSPAPLGILCVHYTVAVPGFWGGISWGRSTLVPGGISQKFRHYSKMTRQITN